MLSAYETLAPRAFGAKRYDQVALLTYQASMLCLLLLIPSFIIWTFSRSIFRALNQPEESSVLASRV